MANMQQA
jgi:hypothetical protein